MSNKAYDRLKWIAQILLPALGALYFALGGVWALPNVEQVLGTITAVDVFLGALLGLSARSYNQSPDRYDGVLDVDVEGDETHEFMLRLKKNPVEIAAQNTFTVKVNNR